VYCGNGLIWHEYWLITPFLWALAMLIRLISDILSAKLCFSKALRREENLIRDCRDDGNIASHNRQL
jgi:hypothetical protein